MGWPGPGKGPIINSLCVKPYSKGISHTYFRAERPRHHPGNSDNPNSGYIMLEIIHSGYHGEKSKPAVLNRELGEWEGIACHYFQQETFLKNGSE